MGAALRWSTRGSRVATRCCVAWCLHGALLTVVLVCLDFATSHAACGHRVGAPEHLGPLDGVREVPFVLVQQQPFLRAPQGPHHRVSFGACSGVSRIPLKQFDRSALVLKVPAWTALQMWRHL